MANGYEEKPILYPGLQTPQAPPPPPPQAPYTPSADPDGRDPNDMNKHLRVRKIGPKILVK